MPRIPAFSRVLVLFFGLALGLAAFSVAVQAAPAPSSPARQALETATNRILASIKNPDYVNPATRGPLRQQIEDEVLHIFDFGEFSSRTVGARWRSFTPQQGSAHRHHHEGRQKSARGLSHAAQGRRLARL